MVSMRGSRMAPAGHAARGILARRSAATGSASRGAVDRQCRRSSSAKPNGTIAPLPALPASTPLLAPLPEGAGAPHENGTPFELRHAGAPQAQAELVALWPIRHFPLPVDGGCFIPPDCDAAPLPSQADWTHSSSPRLAGAAVCHYVPPGAPDRD